MENFFTPIDFEHHKVEERNLYLILNKQVEIEKLVSRISHLLGQYDFGD